MKKKILVLSITLLSFLSFNTQAQSWDTGADLVSSYVWRGTNFSGPAIQPYIEYSSGIFTAGAWGSQGYDGFQEMDLYTSLSFDFGLSIGLTDYYYPSTEYFDTSKESGAHAFEINSGFETGAFSISANYILNEAGGAASAGGDMYYELGLSLGEVDLFAGAGDGWHSSNGDFNLCNIGISRSKEIKFTDSFSLPISGTAILNPEREQFYIVIAISL